MSNIQSDEKIALGNLSAQNRKQSEAIEVRQSLMHELASVLFSADSSEDDVRNAYFGFSNSALDFDHSLAVKPEELKNYLSSISFLDKIALCREISAICVKNPIWKSIIGTREEPVSAEASGKIAYLQSNYSDSAFLSFSRVIKSPRSAYFASFDSVCEAVYSGECEYCILPIETLVDGKLMRFYSMIDKYELKIVYTCHVTHPDSQNTTLFALLRRTLNPSLASDISLPSSRDKKLEIRFSQFPSDKSDGSGTNSSVYSVINAASACSLVLHRIDSMPVQYGDGLLSHCLTFGVYSSDLEAFLTYLALEVPSCYATGFYLPINN